MSYEPSWLKIEARWNEKIQELKMLGVIPQRWTNAKLLAGFLLRIDIMLLYSAPAKIHTLLGQHLVKKGEEKWVKTKKDVLPLKTARRFMYDPAWAQICADMTIQYGDEKESIGVISVLALRDLIIQRNMRATEVGLAFSGKHIPTIKHKRDKTEKQRADRLNKLAQEAQKSKAYGGKDVKNLKGNN